MNELRRTAYLEALGIDAYVSRRQLPGAAATRRLAIVPGRPAATLVSQGSDPEPRVTPSQILDDQAVPRQPARRITAEDTAPTGAAAQSRVPRFSLSAIVAGKWLWLEELGDVPLTVEQVRLVDAMAQALQRARALQRVKTVSGNVAATSDRPDVAQFDWPIHTNRQLALDEEAAHAAVAGFVNRKLEQLGCEGIVILGQSSATRVPAGELDIPAVQTASTAEMLSQPALKAQVWRDLQLLVKTS